MIDAIERYVLLRVIADRIYHWKEESAFEFEPTGKAIAIIDELESLLQEIKEIQGVDFAGNWSTDFSKLKDGERYMISACDDNGVEMTHICLYRNSDHSEPGFFYFGDRWCEHYVKEYDVRAIMPEPKPYKCETWRCEKCLNLTRICRF